MRFIRKLISKFKASLYVFKKAEIMRNIVNKEIGGEYDNLCHRCYFNERYQERARLKGILEPDDRLRISIYLGGALGDYIVYLRFVDEISAVCDCTVDLFLDRISFAKFVYGNRENVTIIHDAENCLFANSCGEYDIALHLDHGVNLRNCRLGDIREKAPGFYETACKIVEYTKANRIDIPNQHERESVILRRAQFLGESKWSKLSCGGAIDMSEMYSNILLEPAAFSVLRRYDLAGKKYITVNYGADKNMGGTAQTKVLPLGTLEGFVDAFRKNHPEYLIVQTGVKGSQPLMGVDCCAFDCRLQETAVILKNATFHVDSEGGLVHLAAQMSTPSIVSFGPTPVYYYGYPRNENVVAAVCNNCMSVTPQWSRVCPRKMQVPACMQSITVDMLMERAEKLLNSPMLQPPVETNGSIDLSIIQKQELQMGRAIRVCLIGPLDQVTFSIAQQARQRGNEVFVYIPVHLDKEVINRRTLLRQRSVHVEFGSGLNIACKNNSFDLLFCNADAEEQSEQFRPYVRQECIRIVEESGQIVWCTGKTVVL